MESVANFRWHCCVVSSKRGPTEPYYSKSEALHAYTCRGKAHEGTTYFWYIGRLYMMWREVPVTLALTYVLPKESGLAYTDLARSYMDNVF